MLRRLSSRVTYANVMSTIAVVVAVGTGSAYAANTVFSTDIVDGEVASVDIKNQDIKSADVKDESLTTFDVSTFLGADVVDGTLTGADVLDNSLSGADIRDLSIGISEIADNSVESSIVQNGSLFGVDIANGSLRDEDIGQSFAVDFAGTIGVVNSNSCVNKPVTGLNAQGDYLLLTPSVVDANGALLYDARYDTASQTAFIHVCNFSNATIDDGTTHFNMLVFDAQ